MTLSHQFQAHLSKIISTVSSYSITTEDIVELLLALSYQNRYGFVPNSTHLKLVELFCLSSGHIQETIHSFRHVPVAETLNSIVLQSDNIKLSPLDFTNIIVDLKTIGYATLPSVLDKCICREILDYSKGQQYSCFAQSGSENIRYSVSSLDGIIPNTLSATMTDSCVFASQAILDIINDPVILGLVSFYLRATVCLRSVSFWHSFESVDYQPSGELAQLFHYDLDEFRWLKLFIFLTDVTNQNGPHVFIPGSHRPGFKHPNLLSRGYSRISDEDMNLYHPRNTWKYITCPAGTMVLADTRCWHKGTALKSGVRTLLQPEYAPSRFSMRLI